MELKEFKIAHRIGALRFYRSNSTSRFVAAFGEDKLLVTTEDFDHKKPGYVYSNPVAEGSCWILSNKAPKEADFTL